ncbi:MAG: transcriptional regulator [Blastocatellia bacterium]
MKLVGKPIYRFDGLELNTALGCLQRGDSERALRPKSYHLLLYLIENRQRLVTKEELIAHIWGSAAVTDDALVQVIVELRRALGDDSRRPRYIKTIPKAGYRFIGAVEAVYTDDAPPLTFEEITSVEFEYKEEIRDDAISPVREVAAVTSPPKPRRWFHLHLAQAVIAVIAIALVAGLWVGLQRRLTRQSSAVA